MNAKRADRGFTIIDLVIYGGLLGILLVILSEFFVTVINLQLRTRSADAVEQDGQFILARTAYDIRRSSTITAPTLGNPNTTLSAMIPVGGVDTLHQYTLDNGTLTLSIGGIESVMHTPETRITGLTFTRLGNSGQMADARDTVRIEFTVASVATGSGQRQRTYATTVSMR